MLKNKKTLLSHYNRKYNFESELNKDTAIVKLHRFPSNRFEAAVYWGKGSGRVLEIGAGSGEILSCLSEFYGEYVATEFSQERVRGLEYKFRNRSGVKIIHNDIEEQNLNFPKEYFDTILMIAVIEHILDPIATLKYCHSFLKPGGKILIYTANIAKWTRRLKLLFGFFPSTGSSNEGLFSYTNNDLTLFDDGHLHYFTFRSLSNVLRKDAGFKKIDFCGHGRTILSRLLPSLFSEVFIIGVK